MAKHDHVIFALIPDWGSGEVHSTLCYAGLVWNAPPANILCDRAKMLAGMWPVAFGEVIEHRSLGENLDEPCAMLDGNDLYALNDFVEEFANSQWGYLPHLAKQPGMVLPAVGTRIVFNRIAVWYGPNRWAWRFGSGQPCAA